MKTTISGTLVRNAIEFVHRAQAAHDDARPDEEVRFSIGAQLMIALAIEGIGNQIAEVAFDTWTWDRLEKADTPFKWRFVSGFEGREPFDPGAEPLQTVQRLNSIRNRIAHPKIEDLGTEIIVRSKKGNLRRNVDLDDPVKDGDFILLGTGKLLDDFGFNVNLSYELTKKAIDAIKTIRQHLAITGLEWVDDMDEDLEAGGDSA